MLRNTPNEIAASSSRDSFAAHEANRSFAAAGLNNGAAPSSAWSPSSKALSRPQCCSSSSSEMGRDFFQGITGSISNTMASLFSKFKGADVEEATSDSQLKQATIESKHRQGNSTRRMIKLSQQFHPLATLFPDSDWSGNALHRQSRHHRHGLQVASSAIWGREGQYDDDDDYDEDEDVSVSGLSCISTLSSSSIPN